MDAGCATVTLNHDAGGSASNCEQRIARMRNVTSPRPISMPQPPADASDARYRDWVTAIASHDQQALGALYDATLGRVYRLALRITHNAASAEEVTGDVYFQAWREAARYDEHRGKVLAWLLTICRSRALDHLRRADEAESHPDPQALVREDGADSALDLLVSVQQDRRCTARCRRAARRSGNSWHSRSFAACRTRKSRTTPACRWARSRLTYAKP